MRLCPHFPSDTVLNWRDTFVKLYSNEWCSVNPSSQGLQYIQTDGQSYNLRHSCECDDVW